MRHTNPELEKEIQEIKAKMTPMNTVKFLAGTLASFGATAAIVALMKGSLAGAKGVTKLLMKLGIFVLACKAGDLAEGYLKEQMDKAEEVLKDMDLTGKKEEKKDE